MAIKKIILVFKTHFDIGFTKLSSEIIDYYSGEMIDQVAETCHSTKDLGDLKYIWTMPSWPLKIMKEHSKECSDKVDALLESGQLAWHALPFTSHYDFAGIAEMLWGMNYARALSEENGKPYSRAAKMTDVPGHGRFLPEMLADAGVRLLHLGCNEFATPPQVPPIFWWEAPSGKRVLTMYNSGYGTGLYPTEDWPFETWMSLMNTSDNSGPQTADRVLKMHAKLKQRYPEAEIVCGTLDDVLEALEKEDLTVLPVVKEDLADSWIHGVSSYPRESAQIRRLRGRLNNICRKLISCSDAAVYENVCGCVTEAYDALTLYAEHTWGLDVKTWLGRIRDYDEFDEYRKNERCRHMEESWQEQTDRVIKAVKACEKAEQALGICLGGQPADEAWEPLSGPCTVEGGNYRLDFSAETGVISALIDKTCNQVLLEEKDGAGVFSYRYDRYGSDDLNEYLRAYGHRFHDWGVLDNGRERYPECLHTTRLPVFEKCERSGNMVRFTYKAADGDIIGDVRRVLLTVAMPVKDEPVRVKIELVGKKATPYIESGSICMPLAMEAPEYFVNKTGSILRPETDIANGANHGFYALEGFAAARDEQKMVAVVSHDSPLLSLGENGVHVYRKQYEAHKPEMRFCLFNNMWGTNFPQWIEGDMSFEFDVFAKGKDELAEVYEMSTELTQDPYGAGIPDIPFVLSAGLRFAAVFPENDAVLLHVHNMHGDEINGTLTAKGWRFTEVDLMGRPQTPCTDDSVETKFKAYELRSFRAERQ